jgi:hypothetical protein
MDPMPAPSSLVFSLSTLPILAAGQAVAVTAEELWAEWQDQSGAMGQTLSAAEVTAGDGSLTLDGFTSRYADDEVSTVGRIEQIVMTENPDGSVSITMTDTYAFTFTFVAVSGDPPVNLGVDITAPGLEITASGEPGARVYAYDAPRITIEEGEISGGDGTPPTIEMMIGIDDFAATYQLDGTDPADMAYDSTTTMSGMAGALDIVPPPSEEGRFKFAFSTGAVEADGAGRLGNLVEVGANPELVPAGFDLNGAFDYERLAYELTFQHPQDAFSMFYRNEGGRIATTFSETELDYSVTATGTSAQVMGADIPVPVDVSVGSAEIALRVPLAPAEAPQTLSARLAYQDVTMGDPIWALFDPDGSIPRDPISVVADLTGSARVVSNLLAMDPEAMGAPPGELRDMTLNELRVSVGGATLTGTGSAEFTPGPIPMPVGAVDLQLNGGNALLDRLQETGLVPIEQIAMVRGMLGAFARPGPTPDTLESTIEFTEGGSITANGVPLQ